MALRFKTLRCPQHLLNDGLHVLAMLLVKELALCIKGTACLAQCKLLWRHPALQVAQQRCQVT